MGTFQILFKAYNLLGIPLVRGSTWIGGQEGQPMSMFNHFLSSADWEENVNVSQSILPSPTSEHL